MRRRLNIKLLAGLIVGTLVFGGGVHFLHGIQVKRNADGLINRAQKARDDDNMTEAIRLLARYLSHFPNDKEVAKRAALDAKTNFIDMMYDGKQLTPKDYKSAVNLIEHGVRVKAFDGELKREAADFWAKIFRFKDAIVMLDQLESLAKKGPPEPVAGEEPEEPAEFTIDDQLLRIDCLVKIAAPEQERLAIEQLSAMVGFDPVKEQFDESVAIDKTQVDAYLNLARLFQRNRGDSALALRTINQMVRLNPGNPKSYLNRARMISVLVPGEEGRRQRSDDIHEAYDLDSADLDIIGAMARLYIEKKEYETAEKLLLQGMDKFENLRQESFLYNMLVTVHSAQNDAEGARAKLNEGLKKNPRDRELLWKKARFVLDDARKFRAESVIARRANDVAAQTSNEEQAKKKFAEVEGMFRSMQKASVDDPRIQYLKARIMIERDGDLLRATKLLDAIRELITDRNLQFDIDVHLSTGYRLLGQYDKRLEVIGRILNAQPGSVSGQESYIETLMLLGRNKEALTYTTNLVKNIQKNGGEISPNIKSMLMQQQMRDGIDDSTKELTEAQSAQLFEMVKRTYADESIPQAQRDAIALQYFRKIKDTEKTIKAIDKMLKEDPTSYAYWGLRMQYAKDKTDAFQIFDRMKNSIDMNTYGVAVLPMEAKLYIKYAPEEAPAAVDRVVSAAQSLPDPQKAALFYEMGLLKMSFLKNPEAGIALMDQASVLQPKRTDILQVLFQDATTKKDGKRVDDIANRISKVVDKTDDAYALIESGRLLYHINNGNLSKKQKTGSIGQARQLITRARQRRPEHVPLIQMLARIQLAEGEFQTAISTLQQAHDIQPSNALIIRQIAQIYRDMGNEPMVQRWMARVPQSARGSSDVRSQLRALYATSQSWTNEQLARVIKLSDDLTSGGKATVKDWMLKSQMMVAAKQFPAAEKAALKATELEASNADTWTNLMTILVAQKKTQAAEALVGRVKSNVPQDAQPMVLGRCYRILRKFPESETSFVSAINNDPNNSRVKRMYAEVLIAQNKINDAANVINQIIASPTPESQPEVQWARRSLARIYASTRSYDDFNKALALLEENADNDKKLSPTDLQILAALCFDRPERESWDRGLIRLEQVGKKRPLSDSELFMQAQLYEKYDDEALWQTAKNLASSVITRNGNNQRIVETYVKWLLKHGEVRAAEQYARTLPKNSVTQLRVKLHAAAQAKQIDKAMAGLNQAVPKAIKTPQDLSELMTMGTIAEEMGQYSPKFYVRAIELYAALTKAAPREVVRLATTMGLYGDTESIRQALQLCRDAAKAGVEDDARAHVAISILRKHQDKWSSELGQDVQQVGQWIKQMSDANPDDLKLRWRLAAFQDMVGRLDEVETEYKAILASPEFTNSMERGMLLNNLAYAMALNGKSGEPKKFIEEAKGHLGPTSDLIDTEGYILYTQGNTELAIKRFERAIKIGPVTAQKYMHLAMAYVKKGDAKKATQAWQNALKAGLSKGKLPPALHDEFDELASSLRQT